MWETPQLDPLFLISPDKTVCPTAHRSLALHGQAIPQFVIYKALNKDVLLVFPFKGMKGAEGRRGSYVMTLGCQEPSIQTPSASCGYQEAFERGPVVLQKTNRLPLIEFFKLPKIAASILS